MTLDARITAIDEQLAALAESEAELDEDRRDVLDAEALLEQMQALARAEEDDVVALDGLWGLLLKLVGLYEDTLEREAREALWADSRVSQAEQALRDAREILAETQTDTNRAKVLRQERALLVEEKAQQIREGNGPEAARLLDLENDIRALTADLSGLDTTIRAGHSSLAMLLVVRTELRRAYASGLDDLYGEPLAVVAKQRHMGTAQSRMAEADARYKSFFEAVGLLPDMIHRVANFGFPRTTAADLFLDVALADLWVLGEINEASQQVADRIHEVRSAVDHLVALRKATVEQRTQRHEHRASLLGDVVSARTSR